MSGISERSYHIGHIVAHIEVAELDGRKSHFLNDDGDGAALDVGISNGQRHAFAFLAYANNDEIAGFSAFGNQRSLEFEKEHFLRELLLAYNLVHK